MTVRAKFVCRAIGASDEQANISLYPVVSGSPENDEFFKATPGGSINLSIVNLAAAAQFEAGREYYVDFTVVPLPDPVPVAEEPQA